MLEELFEGICNAGMPEFVLCVWGKKMGLYNECSGICMPKNL